MSLADLFRRRPQAPDALGAAPDQASALPPAALRGGHLMGDLNAIAASWHGAIGAGAVGGAAVPSPEALVSAAGDLGLEVRYERYDVRSLSTAQCPCVALQKDGSSRLIVARPTPDTFECRSGGETYAMDAAALAGEHAGIVFFVRPKLADDRTHQDQVEEQGPVSPVRAIVQHVLTRQRRNMVHLILAALISNALLIALPLFSMAVYDKVIPHLAWETLWALAIGIAIALLLDMAVRFVRLKLQDAIGLSAQLALHATLFRRLTGINMAQAPRSATGFATASREVEALCQAVPQLMASVVTDLPFFFVMLALLWSISGPVAAVALFGALLLVGIHLLGHACEGDRVAQSAQLGRRHAALLVETADGLETVKASGAANALLNRFERLSDEWGFSGHRSRLANGFTAQASMALTQLLIVLTLVVGVYEISIGAMSVGALTAVTLLIGRMMAPVSMTIGTAHRTWNISRAMGPVKHVLTAPVEGAGDPASLSRKVEGRIDLRQVSAAYRDGGPILTDVSLSITPGEKVAIIGRIGSGKSTLLRLLIGLLEPSAGMILLDSHDIRQMPPARLRAEVGLMRQDTALFDDTLQANIAFGLDRVSPDAFERAVRLSGVQDFASRHQGGYGLQVGPRGERLSGGERQAVALARLLLADPRVVLLDEPTAAMDNALEARIVRDLKRALRERTVILATHRLPLLELVDRIIWLEGGRVIADGPKAEILQRLKGAA
jgi:ATP-binding cassette, subfamily C, bacterial LapB